MNEKDIIKLAASINGKKRWLGSSKSKMKKHMSKMGLKSGISRRKRRDEKLGKSLALMCYLSRKTN